MLLDLKRQEDEPELTGETPEDRLCVPLNLVRELEDQGVDLSSSQISKIILEHVPAGARLNIGTNRGDGSWSVTPLQTSQAELLPAKGHDGNCTLTVRVLGSDDDGMGIVTTIALFDIEVTPPPAIESSPEWKAKLAETRAAWEEEKAKALQSAPRALGNGREETLGRAGNRNPPPSRTRPVDRERALGRGTRRPPG